MASCPYTRTQTPHGRSTALPPERTGQCSRPFTGTVAKIPGRASGRVSRARRVVVRDMDRSGARDGTVRWSPATLHAAAGPDPGWAFDGGYLSEGRHAPGGVRPAASGLVENAYRMRDSPSIPRMATVLAWPTGGWPGTRSRCGSGWATRCPMMQLPPLSGRARGL